MISIVDYGMGNIRSVEKAFIKIGAKVRITSDPKVIEDSKAIVLPGVGAFKDCMKNLDDLNLLDSIIKSIRRGKPYLGICLGLQILFAQSEEFGLCNGMNIFSGKVVRFRFDATAHLKIPHMGWNAVALARRPPIFDGIPDNSFFYFVHSYYVIPEEIGITAGETDYGVNFVSMVWKDNVFATQFHPEKSQDLGLKVLKGFHNFAKK